MRIKSIKILALAILLGLSGCAAVTQKNRTKIYANDCKNPREKIVLYSNGEGRVYHSGSRSYSLTWKEKNRYVTLESKETKNRIHSRYDVQGNLVLQSFADGRDARYFNSKERIRYRCN